MKNYGRHNAAGYPGTEYNTNILMQIFGLCTKIKKFGDDDSLSTVRTWGLFAILIFTLPPRFPIFYMISQPHSNSASPAGPPGAKINFALYLDESLRK